MQSHPDSILIIGSGVFGLSTAWEITKRPSFASTSITVIDDARNGPFPPTDAASVDSSRIIRADYADPHYSALGAEAQKLWRQTGKDELGGEGRYTESGFVLTANETPVRDVKVGTKTGMQYTKESWRNIAKMAEEGAVPREKVRTLGDAKELREALGMGDRGYPGDWGYLNGVSGWGDAGKGMKWLFAQVKATGRVNFIDGQAEELITKDNRVVGARLAKGEEVHADIVFVAAGAWTGKLIDMRGHTEASGHVLGYLDITEEELAVLSKQPVVLNLTTGLFVIPPRDKVLKIARHSFGYLNPITITRALPPSPAIPRESFIASIPLTSRDNGGVASFPSEADRDLRRALTDLIPVKGLENRPWKEGRICWYSDTRDGDFLVDWHPGWEGLFVATGDSGHGYKFLPVLGEKVVDCLIGTGGELGRKWRWKSGEDDGMGREGEDGVYRGLITEDGSRGGLPGMILSEELNK